MITLVIVMMMSVVLVILMDIGIMIKMFLLLIIVMITVIMIMTYGNVNNGLITNIMIGGMKLTKFIIVLIARVQSKGQVM